MRDVALDEFSLHLRRVKARAFACGHSASESTVRRIYESSLANLARALEFVDILRVYDNTAFDAPPRLVLEAHAGHIVSVAEPAPGWLSTALDLH